MRHRERITLLLLHKCEGKLSLLHHKKETVQLEQHVRERPWLLKCSSCKSCSSHGTIKTSKHMAENRCCSLVLTGKSGLQFATDSCGWMSTKVLR